MRIIYIAAVTGLCLSLVQGAQAQTATSFRGFRAEVQAGGDRFQSQGDHKDKFGFGGAIGFDGVIADKIVIGPEFGYWRARGENITPGVDGGVVANKSFQELSAGIRAGYLVTPKTLVYGYGGYADNEQRKSFSGILPDGSDGFYNHYHTTGYQVGGGAEYSLTDMFYVGAGYRYSNYGNHTSRQRLFASAGIRFK